MARVYFVRHAQSDLSIHDELTRPLTDKGIADSKRVTEFLRDKDISLIFSSPYRRAIDTIKDFAVKSGMEIRLVDDFRERNAGTWVENYKSFSKRQWADFDYQLEGGESLNQVQQRNIAALHNILYEHDGRNIAVGTHGTALCTMINYYYGSFGYMDFERVKNVMPWIVILEFENNKAMSKTEFCF